MQEKTLDHIHGLKSLTLTIGETFSIRLPEIPVTGYRWTLHITPESSVELLTDSFIQEAAHTGGGGTRTFRLAAKEKGETSLNLILRREWESEKAPASEYKYAVFIE